MDWRVISLSLFLCITLVSAQKKCKPGECGSGQCERGRCKCPQGYMSVDCARPCQDTYQACANRWQKEGRCRYGPIGRTRWYDENCAATCGQCTPLENWKLDIPIPFLIEDLSWIVGKWEGRFTNGDRFPIDMSGPHTDTLYIRPEHVTMFDRPALNFTAIAVSEADSTDIHKDIGFMTSKFYNEDTGFEPPKGHDPDKVEIGLELNSNTGLNTVEEGKMENGKIIMTSSWIKAYPGMEWAAYKSMNRTFSLNRQNPQYLEEEAVAETWNGRRKNWHKYYWKSEDFLLPQAS